MHLSESLHEQHQHERMFQEVVDASEDAILLIDNTTNQFVGCNESAVRMLRADGKQALLFAHPWNLSPTHQPDGRRSEEKSAEMNALAEAKRFHRFEWQHLRMNGEPFPVEVTLTPIQIGQKKLLHAVWRDLTDIKRIEASRNRAHRARSMLSSGNRTLVRSKDESSLLREMCRVAVDVGGYRMAWIGYKQHDDGRSVRPMAQAGFEDGYLDNVAISWGEDEYSRGPTGLAIRTGKVQIVQDFINDPQVAPWRDEALKRGFSASAALPLLHNGSPFGAMVLYAEHTDAFDKHEMPILEEMVEDLAYGIVTLRNDIARRQAEDDSGRAHSLLQAALEATADGLLVTTLSGEIETCNRQFVEMFGIPEAVIASNQSKKVVEFLAHRTRHPNAFLEHVRELHRAVESDHRDLFELKDERVIERISRPQRLNGKIIGRVCSFRDISAQKKYEQQLVYLANHDALTGLPNRNLLNDRLKQAIAHAHRSGSMLAVLFFDIDRFKLINDSMGHEIGDKLLLQLAQRLPGCLREGDTAARMGGDEFVVLLMDIKNEEDAATMAQQLLDVIAATFVIAEREFFALASIGIALYPRDGDDAATLVKHADAAMYRAKERGGNRFQFFTSGINEHVARRLELAGQLRHALQRNELQVYLQPQIDLQQNRLVGAEALLRWRHPEIGMVSPAEFIPVAEETGMIVEIGTWVAETACRHLKAWQTAGLPAVRIAINLSARQFDSENLAATFAQLLAQSGIGPAQLELEITEGMVMQQPERAARTLNELKDIGFSIAMDDFGTGYSSLGYLKRFPIDKLKVDRTFVMDVTQDKDDAAITRAMIAMAHELRMKVVAEGVETDEQLTFLRQHQCDFVQGYLTGRPVPAAEFEAMLRAAGG